jgi:hypothetical protein
MGLFLGLNIFKGTFAMTYIFQGGEREGRTPPLIQKLGSYTFVPPFGHYHISYRLKQKSFIHK